MIYGKKKTIDQFVEKLTVTIESKISDYKAFIELQRECVQILENFNDKLNTDLEGMRRLGYFRLQVKHLLHNHFKTKDAVEFEHQIMGSMEYLIDFLDMELGLLDTKAKFPATTTTNDAKSVSIADKKEKSDFTWTDSKSDLIEILHSILLLRSINNGKVKKSDFILFMGEVFNVDLKNHSGLFNDILNRYDDPQQQYSRLYYLRQMVDALSMRLKELDENTTRRR